MLQRHIVIAEDLPSLSRRLAHLVQTLVDLHAEDERTVSVSITHSAQTAFRQITEQHRPDQNDSRWLILTDGSMPADKDAKLCTGLDLARAARELLHDRVRIILLTGDTLPNPQPSFLDGMLQKPYAPEALKALVTPFFDD